MREAVLYARVSTSDQEKEGYSIPAQIKLLEDYANAERDRHRQAACRCRDRAEEWPNRVRRDAALFAQAARATFTSSLPKPSRSRSPVARKGASAQIGSRAPESALQCDIAPSGAAGKVRDCLTLELASEQVR